MIKFSALALMALSLASCGGDSGSDDYQMTIDQVNAKQAEAISLAASSPCNAVQQCGNLMLSQPLFHCTTLSYRAYSLVSPTADAASAAAADERTLAGRAAMLAPPPDTACPASVVAPPQLACVANTCQAVAPTN
jgi:hypothetical protein